MQCSVFSAGQWKHGHSSLRFLSFEKPVLRSPRTRHPTHDPREGRRRGIPVLLGVLAGIWWVGNALAARSIRVAKLSKMIWLRFLNLIVNCY